MPQYAPTSRFGKIMDFIRRGEYMTAGITEHALGKSPYRTWHEAGVAGFTGKRRVDYIDLTGDPVLGLFLGIALDPITYVPFGAIPKIAKATRIPGTIGKLARIAGRRWPTLQKAGVNLRFLVGDPTAKLKWVSGFDKAIDTMRVKGVSDDFVKAIKTAGALSDEMAEVAKKAGVFNEAKKIAEISRVIGQGLEVPGKLTTLKASMIDEYADMARWFGKLSKEHPKKAKAMLDLFEKSLPEKMVTLGESKVVWGMGDEFMGALKKMGVSQDEINDVLARVTRPVVGADEAYRMKAAYSYLDDVNGTIKHFREFPDHYRLPEFQELMDVAISKLDPEAASLFKRAQYVQSTLVNRAIQKRLLDAKMLDRFASDLKLNYLPHLTAPQNYKRLRGELIKRGKRSFDELLGMSRKYKGQIVDEKLLKELIDADNYDSVIDVLTGVDKAGLRKAGVPLEDINKLTRIQKSMTQFRTVDSGLTDIAARLEKEVGKKGAKLFEMNLPKLLFEQEIRMRSAFLYQSYIKKLLRQYENTPLMKKVTEGVDVGAEIATKDMVRITDKLVGDFLVHKDLALAFESCIKITTGKSNDFQKFVRMYDKGLGMWKYGTLIPFGKFHIRNLASEMLLNNIAGMWLVDPAYVKAAKLLKAVKAGDKAARGKYYELMRKGVIKTGFFSSELGSSRKLITPMWKRVTGMKKMEQLGEFTEDFPRIAMHLWATGKAAKNAKWLKKMGFDSVDDMVRKFHPVYDRFTPFEKGVAKRIFPFYSWSRFNLPLHAEMFVQNPKHYATIERTRHAITQLRGGQLPDDIDPEWIKEGYVIGWSKKPGKRTYIVLRGWLPHADLGELLAKRGVQDLITRQLTPVKAVGEVFFGYDLFKKRSLPAYPGEKTVVLGARVASRYAHLLSPIRVYQEVNRFFFKSKDPYWDRVVFHLFGRAYTIDEKKAKRQLKYDMGKAIGELKFGIKRAKQNQDYGTMKKLEQQKIKLERAVRKL